MFLVSLPASQPAPRHSPGRLIGSQKFLAPTGSYLLAAQVLRAFGVLGFGTAYQTDCLRVRTLGLPGSMAPVQPATWIWTAWKSGTQGMQLQPSPAQGLSWSRHSPCYPHPRSVPHCRLILFWGSCLLYREFKTLGFHSKSQGHHMLKKNYQNPPLNSSAQLY